MTGLRRAVVAFALLWWFAGSARAQGVVPGGWSNQFGFQSFVGPDHAGYGYGYGGYGVAPGPFAYGGGTPYGIGAGMSPYGMGPAVSPYGIGLGGYPPVVSQPYAGVNSFGMTGNSAQTVNGTDALIDVIRHSVRRPVRR